MDVALISSLGAGCYDCPVMRAVAAARLAGRGQGGAVAIEAHKVQIPGRRPKTKGGSR